jgi:outer membrane protein X
MKKLISLSAVVVLLMMAQETFAQNKLGVFLGYGSEVEEVGIGVNGEFGINDKMAISPSFVYWFPPADGVSWWELNGNLNYYFQEKFYGLVGLNFFHFNYDYLDVSDTEVGLNLGVGYNFDTGGKVIPFGEAKFVLSDADQLALLFGIRFTL